MKFTRLMKINAVAIAIVALSLVAGGRFVVGQHGVGASSVAGALAPGAMPMGLPSDASAKAVLDESLLNHHPQYVDVPMGSVKIRTFVIYPDLAGKLPVVVVTEKNQGMSDWVRAVGTSVVNEGLIAVVPDILSGMGPNGGGTDSFPNRAAVASALGRMSPSEIQRRTEAVRDYFVSRPGSNGKSAILDFNLQEAILNAVVSTPGLQRVVKFELTEHAWHNVLPLLTGLAEPMAMPAQAMQGSSTLPADVIAANAANQSKAQKEIAQRHDILPFMWNAGAVVARSPRHGEWVDIPMTTQKGPIKLHAWLVQPLGTEKAGVVVVIHAGPGMDMGENPNKGGGATWIRGAADSVAANGFIAIAPDLTSGLGPNGGNFDSFAYADDVGKAVNSRSDAEKLELVKTARDYALKLPRANGKSGATGFCLGGGLSWEAAAIIPGLNAAVSFYGGPPDPDTMAKIEAPLLIFDGDLDLAVVPRLLPAIPQMQKLGKVFEYKIYPGATHGYLYQQQAAQNAAATLDSWVRTMAFFKKYLS